MKSFSQKSIQQHYYSVFNKITLNILITQYVQKGFKDVQPKFGQNNAFHPLIQRKLFHFSFKRDLMYEEIKEKLI